MMIPSVTIYDESTDGRYFRILTDLGTVIWDSHRGLLCDVQYLADAVSIIQAPPPARISPEEFQAQLLAALAECVDPGSARSMDTTDPGDDQRRDESRPNKETR